MPRLTLLAALLTLAPLSLPDAALAQVLVGHQRLVGVLNPIGAEHMVSVGARASLDLPDELLFGDTHVELGLVNYTSPIYSRTGGYFEIQPLAIAIVRAEVRQVSMWSIGMPGAGYYPVLEGQVDGQGDELGEPGTATGIEAQVSVTVQGAVPLGDLRLLAWDQLAYELIHLGDAARYASPRHDAVLMRDADVLTNSAMLLLGVPLTPQFELRVGAYDEVQWLPETGALTHQVGPLVALTVERPAPGVHELTPLIRAGVFTEGRRTAEFTLLLGLLLEYR